MERTLSKAQTNPPLQVNVVQSDPTAPSTADALGASSVPIALTDFYPAQPGTPVKEIVTYLVSNKTAAVVTYTATLYDALGNPKFTIASGLPIPVGATVSMLPAEIYLLPGESIKHLASAATSLDALISMK